MSDVDSLVALLRGDEKETRAERKSNECIDWMSAHWRLFAKTKKDYDRGLKTCGESFSYTPDGLAEALGLDERLCFTKIAFNDIPGQLLKPNGSQLLARFNDSLSRQKSGECALLVIAGDRTCVVTNMQTSFVKGLMHMFIKAADGDSDIHIINWKDLPQRLPQIFDHSGDTNE